ncbi:hypothetical protein BDV96DRAFT_563664 [Lophiotrema nucula]|uniref:Uncharacterized protein n=1 Tax=Lophiotrema nucula TaxID=690887 RepID=A0A6A5ZS91_9PLEO|nr:hypothetical protein BDV96DRAFT_563664 [Lophiotrema nucula]
MAARAYLIYPPQNPRPYSTTNGVIANDCRRWGWVVYELVSLDALTAEEEEQELYLGNRRVPLAILWDRELRRRQREGEPDHQSSASSFGGRAQSRRRSIYTSHWYGYEQHHRIAERQRARAASMSGVGTTGSISAVLEEEGVRLNSPIRRAVARIEHTITHGGGLASLQQNAHASRDDDDEDPAEQLPPYSPGEDVPAYDP